MTSAGAATFVFSDNYNLDLGPHVFPAVKYRYIYEGLQMDERFAEAQFVEPKTASREEVALVHSRAYVRDMIGLERTKRTYRSELPLTQDIIDAFFLSTGGTIETARIALRDGKAMNLGGGFHHAYADHAEGFCYINDVAVAMRVLEKEKLIKRALIIDLDLHQGNGTAHIFRNDRKVFTFSMHEEDNYPVKESGSLDIGLPSGIKDDEYLQILDDSMRKISESFKPDIVFYLAGVDIYEDDRLGRLSITKKGIAARDEMVFDFWRNVPIATVLAGGYARDELDTVALHLQTCEVMAGKQESRR